MTYLAYSTLACFASACTSSPSAYYHRAWTHLYIDSGEEVALPRNLVITDETDLEAPPELEITSAITEIEDTVVEAIRPLLPPHRRPQFILGYPGRSKTDPIYAMRFLEKARELMGMYGYLIVFDKDDHELTQRYYEETLPLGYRFPGPDEVEEKHTLVSNWGPAEGSIESLRSQYMGHMAMALMPGSYAGDVATFFSRVLVRGGVAIWADYFKLEHEEGKSQFEEFMTQIAGRFRVLGNPLRPSPYKTAFSAPYPHSQVLLLQKR